MKQLNRLIVAGAATLLPFAAAFAQQAPSSTPDQSAPAQSEQPARAEGRGATFESLDVDSDGKISKTEAAANSTVSSKFSSYDLNGDGFIERAEVNQANNSQSETPKQ